jgi:hypothetical protein
MAPRFGSSPVAGGFDHAARSYSDNLVVYARMIRVS